MVYQSKKYVVLPRRGVVALFCIASSHNSHLLYRWDNLEMWVSSVLCIMPINVGCTGYSGGWFGQQVLLEEHQSDRWYLYLVCVHESILTDSPIIVASFKYAPSSGELHSTASGSQVNPDNMVDLTHEVFWDLKMQLSSLMCGTSYSSLNLSNRRK